MREIFWFGYFYVVVENRKVGVIGWCFLYWWCNELFLLFYLLIGELVLEFDGCGVDMLGIINESVFFVVYIYCFFIMLKIFLLFMMLLFIFERVIFLILIVLLVSGVGMFIVIMFLLEVDILKFVFNSIVFLIYIVNCVIICFDDEVFEEKEFWVYFFCCVKWKLVWFLFLDCIVVGGFFFFDFFFLEGMIREVYEEVWFLFLFFCFYVKFIGENRLMFMEIEIGEEGC